MLVVLAWFERDILRDRVRAKKGEGVGTPVLPPFPWTVNGDLLTAVPDLHQLQRSPRSPIRRTGLHEGARLCEKPPGRHPCLLEVEWGAEALVHQQGARHDVDARRQSRGLPGLRFEGAVRE